MGKVEFDIYEDLERVNANSLLIDSETEVASLQVGNIYLSLMCYGDVRVNYGEETFYCASDYPQIVTDYFLGKIEDKELLDELENELWVGDNNWFQIMAYIVRDKAENDMLSPLEDIEIINGYTDICDIEGSLTLNKDMSMSTNLYNFLFDYLKWLKEEYQDRVEELKDLDLSNL